MSSFANTILEFLDNILPKTHARPEIAALYSLMRDYPWRGGKMIRSKILVASCLAHGGTPEAALPLAAGLELFQNWVLIHDDIEDDSDERRGQPALHRLYGMPLALNAGDALHVYMWQVVHEAAVPNAFETFLEMIHRTAEGQHLDLSWVQHQRWDIGVADYLELVRLKTAFYTVVAPLQLGALAARVSPDAGLEQAGLDLGIAFQIRDDVLNLTANFSDYGKEIGGDILEGKRTLMLIRLLELATPAIRAEVIAILEQPRETKTQSQVEHILGLIKQYDCVAFAQEIADQHAAKGLAQLTRSLENAPNRTAVAEILETARTLATRQS